MRATTAEWPLTLTAAHRLAVQISSYRAGVRLADRIPITAGEITYDDTALLRRRLSITVPATEPNGVSWDPGDDPTRPLAAYGQRLYVLAGIEHPTGTAELVSQGWYLIQDWTLDETANTLDLDAVDLAQLLADARLYTAESPPDGSTYASEFRRLANGILPVWISPALVDRPISSATVWDQDRTTSLNNLCTAWGARWYIDDRAQLAADLPYPLVQPTDPPVYQLTGGQHGTVVARQRSGDRERLYNAVVATGQAPDDGGPVPYAVAEITDPASPIRVDGPYGRRPRFYASDLLTTTQMCQNAANALLIPASTVSRTEPIDAVPDPALELGDIAAVTTSGGRWIGRVTSITLPLTATGAMNVTLSSAPADEPDES